MKLEIPVFLGVGRLLQGLPEELFSMEGRILFDRGGIILRQNNEAVILELSYESLCLCVSVVNSRRII